MSSSTTLESKLKALQCHFTWGLDLSRPKLLRLRDKLEDVGTEEGNSWLGHIYNLRGFFQYKLESAEDALGPFTKAAEAFRQTRGADSDDGPWLVVNYGNLAWLHHHLGNQEESQAYLSKVDALMVKHPSQSKGELHPEVNAEKAWTLMKFGAEKRTLTARCFEKAIRKRPDMVEWNTSHVLALASAFKHNAEGLDDDLMEKMRIARLQDPENMYLAFHFLGQRAKKGESVQDEARELISQVLKNPVSSYSGMKAALRVYRNYASMDEAIELAEEALGKHPDQRYLKRCAALCYKWKITSSHDIRPRQSMVERAISLQQEVIALYPHSSLVKEVDLANMYVKSSHGQVRAEEKYQELLKRDLEPEDKQMLYNNYAKYLNFERQARQGSVQFHMKAAAIPHQSFFRQNSIRTLEKIRDRSKNRKRQEIDDFLRKLQRP